MKDPAGYQDKISDESKRAILKNLKQSRYIPTVSDYERQISKPENKKKSCETIKKQKAARQQQAEDMGLTEEQLTAFEQGTLELESAPIAYKYAHGKDLLEDTKELQKLPTRMRELHNWYKEQTKNGSITFGVRVPTKIYHQRNEHTMWIEFESLFYLFQKRDLDIQLLSLWTIMEAQQCIVRNINHVAFLDLERLNNHTCNGRGAELWDLANDLARIFLEFQRKESILLAYECDYHYVLIEIMLEQSVVNVYDSKRRPLSHIIALEHILNMAFEQYRKKSKRHRPFWKDFTVKRMDMFTLTQPLGNNQCGFYVMWAMHQFTGDGTSAGQLLGNELNTR
ncbi:uncharacterized protein LOC120643368 [Panicum virgatum]|nr:uncharacterized protein LOC120643368 [Panicum virgatum]